MLITIVLTICISLGSIYLMTYEKKYFPENTETIEKEIVKKNELKEYICGRKTKIYIVGMFLLNILLAAILNIIYKDNSMILNLKLLIIVGILWAVAYIDYKHLKIPNEIILIGLLIRTIYLFIECIYYKPSKGFLISVLFEILVVIILFVVCMIINFIMKNALGLGDVKLMMLMALYLGKNGIMSAIILSLFVSFFLSLFFLISKKKSRKDVIPFGPSLLIGTYLSIFLFGI